MLPQTNPLFLQKHHDVYRIEHHRRRRRPRPRTCRVSFARKKGPLWPLSQSSCHSSWPKNSDMRWWIMEFWKWIWNYKKKRSLDMKMNGLIWFNGNLMGFQWVLLGFNGMSWVLNMEINGILMEMNMDTLFSFFFWDLVGV